MKINLGEQFEKKFVYLKVQKVSVLNKLNAMIKLEMPSLILFKDPSVFQALGV